MRYLLLFFVGVGGFAYGASHHHAPAAPHLTMPNQALAMDDDAEPIDTRSWLNDHTAQANTLYACGLISQGEYSADRVADGIRRMALRIATPEALARDRQSVAAEMRLFRLHTCRELAEMPFAGSWRPLP